MSDITSDFSANLAPCASVDPLTNLLYQAQSLISSGISVIPIRSDGTKAPAHPEWKPYQQRLATTEELVLWFGNGSNNGLALVGGEISGGLEILDFDAPEFFKPWGEAVKVAGGQELLKRLVYVQTPSGGWHLMYRCPKYIQGNQKLAQRLNDDGKIKTVIETRGEGGYALTVGSPAQCHPAGKPYVLKRGDLQHIPLITAEERDLLISCARSFNKYIPVVHEHYVKQESGGIGRRPGDDLNNRADWDQILEPHGWGLVRRLGVVGFWRKPGDTDPGHHATTNHSGTNLLYVFSSSAAPFEPEQAYSKFSAYALLNHGGDYKKAAAELARQGYGAHEPNIVQEENSEQELIPPPMYPMLPAKALFGLAGEVAKLACENSEADPVAVLLTFLAWAGTCFGSDVFVEVGDTRHCPRIYTAIVGSSSKARKGTSKDPCQRVLKALPEGLGCRVSGGPLSSGEGLVNAVRDPSDKRNKEGDPEDPGVADKRLFVIESEWAASLKATGRDTNTLSAIMRMAFDSGDIEPLTKHNRIKATGAHIGFVGHITLEEFARLLGDVDIYNGYANRILFACVRRQKIVSNPKPMSRETVKRLADKLAGSIRVARDLCVIAFDDEAQQVWAHIYPQLSKDRPGKFGAATARAEALTIRLALIFALLDMSSSIRVKHLEAALAVWQFCFESARFIFGDSEADPTRAKILQALFVGEKTMTELNRLFGGRHSTQIKAALIALQASGMVNQRKEVGKNGGRATTYFTLNKNNCADLMQYAELDAEQTFPVSTTRVNTAQ